MTVSSIKMTARQYLMLGEDPPGVRLELVHGEISVSPSPTYEHGFTGLRLAQILANHVDEHDLGELVADIDTIFDELNVRRPDLLFIVKARLHLLADKRHGIHFPPDLCVEIVSPGSATMDQTDKFDLYAKSGVPHYWLLDPANLTFNAFNLSGMRYIKNASGVNDDVVTAEPFPKLKLSLARLWAPAR